MNLKENGLAWTGLVRRRIGAYDMLFFYGNGPSGCIKFWDFLTCCGWL